MKPTRRSRFIRLKRTITSHDPMEAPREDVGEPSTSSAAPVRQQEPHCERGDLHTRIVIPRQDRADAGARSLADVELREVRFGATTRGPYLRVVPKQRRFIKSAPGYLEATELASGPAGARDRWIAAAKRIALGSPFASSRLLHERLTKVRALGVFSSDPLSSSAYSAEEIMLVLVLAGSGALYLALPITGVLLALLWVVRLSYVQTIRAYPGGGGAYIVAHENLGVTPALVAAAALLVDYVLTVAVSVAAGVAAITSAAPVLLDLRVPLSLLAIAVITWGNLRGIRESGAMFGLPTYFFITSFSAMIAVGLFKLAIGDAPGSLLHSAPPAQHVAAVSGLSIFLVLRAFSSGAAAVTGIEAISNGVPAFKPPESRNAQVTMQWEAAFLGVFLLGVAFLATRYGVVPHEGETVVSILGRDVLGQNVLYYGYQVATAGVLFLAANTAYADFPRLSAILAKDQYAPRQLSFRGDRLAFSNGIMLLGAAAAVLLVVFQAEVTRLIPLYILGVFISMTLSQSGMVRHWLRLRERGWQVSLVLNGVGALATGTVVLVVGATKFTEGAWISVLAMLTLFTIFTLIHRHYEWFRHRVRTDEGAAWAGAPAAVPVQRLPGRAVVPVDDVNRITLGAVRLARETCSDVTAVHLADEKEVAEEFRLRWNRLVPDVPLVVIESPYRAFVAPVLAYIESLEWDIERRAPGEKVTVILPAFVTRHWWEGVLHNRDAMRLKPFLKARSRVRVIECPYRLSAEQA